MQWTSRRVSFLWFEGWHGAGSATDRQYVMRRRILKIAAAVSLVLCVAALALWCESHWRAEVLMLRCGPDSLVAVESERGRIALVSRSHDSKSVTKHFSFPLSGHQLPIRN